jgi:hypothetical protein
MSAVKNLGQWVLPVFFSPLGVNLIPKSSVEREFEFDVGVTHV